MKMYLRLLAQHFVLDHVIHARGRVLVELLASAAEVLFERFPVLLPSAALRAGGEAIRPVTVRTAGSPQKAVVRGDATERATRSGGAAQVRKLQTAEHAHQQLCKPNTSYKLFFLIVKFLFDLNAFLFS